MDTDSKLSFDVPILILSSVIQERLIAERVYIEMMFKGDEEKIKDELELATIKILKDLKLLTDVKRCTYLNNASVEQKFIMSGATHTQKLLFMFSRNLNNNSEYRYNVNLIKIQEVCNLIYQILTFAPPEL